VRCAEALDHILQRQICSILQEGLGSYAVKGKIIEGLIAI